MSSPETPPEGDEPRPEPAAEEAAGNPAAEAEVERTAADPDQPAPTPSATADAAVGRQAEAALADKEAQAEAAAEAAAATTSGAAGAAPAPEAPEAGTPEPEPEPEPDPARDPMIAALAEHLGDDLVASHVVRGVDAWVRVRPEAWHRAGEVCRDVLGLTYFGHLSAIDWLPSPYGKSEDGGLGRDEAASPTATAELAHGVTGGETRFQLIARLQNHTTAVGLHLKADVPDDTMAVATWSGLFAGADWHERETWEMFGIDFVGHPDLVHIYLPGEFEGYPLRKDFPLLAREVKPWPGLVDVEPMPGEEPAEDEAGADA